MKKADPTQMVKRGLHLGHKAKKINPKARKYIYKIEKGVCIIDLYQTAKQIDAACNFLFKLGKDDKKILFTGTKRHSRNLLVDISQKNGINYMTEKWIGGFITNFDEISKNIKKMRETQKERDEGVWKKLPKHEILALEKKLTKMRKIFSGVENLENLPDAIFIIDTKKEETALKEARSLKVPTIAVVDTNSDPSLVEYPIVANDDSIQSIEYITNMLAEAYSLGRGAKKS